MYSVKTALRESFLEVIWLFFCITILCGEICCFYWGALGKGKTAALQKTEWKFSVSTTVFLCIVIMCTCIFIVL